MVEKDEKVEKMDEKNPIKEKGVKKETTKKEKNIKKETTKKEVKNEEKNTSEKKNETSIKKSIVPRTAVKGLLNGFVSYGIMIIFIFLVMVVFVTWIINNNRQYVNYNVLKISLPLLAAFIIFFLIRGICRLSTYDLFKDCKIEKKDIDNVCTKMNLFYICLVIFTVAIIILYLTVRFSNERARIKETVADYYQIDNGFAVEKEEELIQEYEENRSDVLIQTLIVESGVLLGLFSLIPDQRRLINRYN